MAMTLAELRADVRELIGAGIFDRCFEPAWANDAVNFACEQVASLLGLTFTLSSSIPVSGCKADIPSDAMVLQLVKTMPSGATMGKILLSSSRTVEDAKNPFWRDRTAEPTVYIQETGASLRLNGQPASGAVIVGYIQRPTAMVVDADMPDVRIPSVFHDHLRYAAKAYLLQLDGPGKNMEEANLAFETFGRLIGAGPLKLAEVEVDR